MSKMDIFYPIKETDTRQLLKRSSNAFCAFDPMPTCLVKHCLGVLISQITHMVNRSVFSQDPLKLPFKTINKNHSMDCNILNNHILFQFL